MQQNTLKENQEYGCTFITTQYCSLNQEWLQSYLERVEIMEGINRIYKQKFVCVIFC